MAAAMTAASSAAFGCSSESGGAGFGGGGAGVGGGGASGDDPCDWEGPAIGASHPGPEEKCSYRPFFDACEAEGGLVDGACYGGGYQWGGTCYAPPPAPTAAEFACEDFTDHRHVMNCAEGSVCVVQWPPGDGCYGHSCAPLAGACAATPTCACLEQHYMDTSPEYGIQCAEDADGNITLTTAIGLPPP